jgi:hypothetical protein
MFAASPTEIQIAATTILRIEYCFLAGPSLIDPLYGGRDGYFR